MSNPCMNGGECVEERDAYKCKCTKKFKGNNCQTGWCREHWFCRESQGSTASNLFQEISIGIVSELLVYIALLLIPTKRRHPKWSILINSVQSNSYLLPAVKYAESKVSNTFLLIYTSKPTFFWNYNLSYLFILQKLSYTRPVLMDRLLTVACCLKNSRLMLYSTWFL